jgi:hypothetical protein
MKKFGQLEISRWAFDGENEQEFVLAKEAEDLEQLNKEMLEVLKAHEKFWRQSGCYTEEIYALQCKTQRVIAKAEEV